MKNSLLDLNNHLFVVLERLNDEDIAGERLEQEISRAKAVNSVAESIVNNARVALEAEKLKAEYADFSKPKMIER
ncbi:hypothetical protein [Neisseria musculi]|uniref:Phage protein n=1 Tax=Neisseria musculi TaxID=1815583 RepID=A0A7H1MDD9_9NEIS|nr:hypothetical protein [Neisseria musculi]QNT59654.1 putative phage protein [Neisseria musculi]